MHGVGKLVAGWAGALMLAGAAHGAAGQVDTTFGSNGVATIAHADGVGVGAMLVRGDGSTIIAGTPSTTGTRTVEITRLLPNGTVDGNYGSGGHLVVSTTHNLLNPKLAADPNSDLVYVAATEQGSNGYDVRICRVTANGAIDNSWFVSGSFGCASLNFSSASPDYFLTGGVAVDGFGQVVIGGAHLNLSGTGASSRAASIAIPAGLGPTSHEFMLPADPTVQITAVISDGVSEYMGGTMITGSDTSLVVMRLANGAALDPEWGLIGSGAIAINVNLVANGYDIVNALALSPAGNLILAGTVDAPGGQECVWTRMRSDGSNTDFNLPGNGLVHFNIAGPAGSATGCNAVASVGDKVVVGGLYTYGSGADFDFLVAQFFADGTPDPAFGNAGKSVLELADPISGTRDERVTAIGVTRNGTIIAAGSNTALHASSGNFQITRVLNDEAIFANGFDP
ncbi:MAG TPA: hypothetical protein VF132_06580 [Rudaea sp.]